jgi:hypothetical protein
MRVAITMTIAIATTVSGHHSTSIYNTDTLLSIEGIVTEYEWRNPHTYIQIAMTDGEAG